MHPGDFAQATEGAAPVTGECLFRTDTGPEPVALADARARFERFNDEWRKRDVHGHAGLLRVEERAITGQPVNGATRGIADAQSGAPRKLLRRDGGSRLL